MDDFYESDYTKLAHFEKMRQDFVLGIIISDKDIEKMELDILMTNGYN